MKIGRWLFVPLLALLTACVSYYQPETAFEDGVYYPEDDPSYRYNSDDFYFTRVAVYPWASLDSFYFGYWPYTSYGYGYRPYWGYSFSYVYPDEPGFAAGYYAFYSPWYARAYSTYYYPPVWRPYRNDCYYHGRCGARDKYVRNAGGGSPVFGYPGGGEENAFYSNRVKDKSGHAANAPTNRYAAKTKSRPVHSRSRSRAADMPMERSSSSFSGYDTQSPSFGPPSRSQSSGYGKSSRARDRD